MFFFQAEDGIRDLVRSRGLGDVYKRQEDAVVSKVDSAGCRLDLRRLLRAVDANLAGRIADCLLYTSDAADERSSVDLGGRRIIKKKKRHTNSCGDVVMTTYKEYESLIDKI